MISTMTFERAAEIHAEFLSANGGGAGEARDRLLTFLGWDEPDE
jgi:hypothetical protein